MPDNWEFKSHTYDNCNCSVSCGCQFNEPSTHGNCLFAYTGTIVEGHFNDTSLEGLNWSLLCIFLNEIEEGNGKRQIIIDERADEAGDGQGADRAGERGEMGGERPWFLGGWRLVSLCRWRGCSCGRGFLRGDGRRGLGRGRWGVVTHVLRIARSRVTENEKMSG